MRSSRLIACVILAGMLSCPFAAWGEKRVVVAAGVRLLKVLSRDMPDFIPEWVADETGFTGSVRFVDLLTDAEIEALEAAGVQFFRRFGGRSGAAHVTVSQNASGEEMDGVDHVGTIYPVRVAWNALDVLIAFPKTAVVESEYVVPPTRPLNVTKPLTGAVELSGYLAKELGTKPGAGVKIGDIDSGIDVFHPAFFYADGGYYRWLDVDRDGKVTFGKDAVDLDGDGQAGAGEVISYLDVSLVDIEKVLTTGDLGPDGEFQADLDWVYVDVNGNSNRDHGPEAGYTDQSPAFGEPVFVVDDVNRNGVLDLDEKLVLLKTPKIKKAYVNGKEYVAGVNLSFLTLDKFEADSYWVPAGMHGTGVAGIIGANNPGLGRFVGIAPYADIYMIHIGAMKQSYGEWDGTIPKLIWARDQGIDILLLEFLSWGVTFMDGTSNLEKAMDELYQTNRILLVVPAGNLADSGKHMETRLPPGESEVVVKLPAKMPKYQFLPFETPAYVFSLYWKGSPDEIEVKVAPPGGTYVEIPEQVYEPVPLGKNMVVISVAEVSPAGFVHRMCYVMDLGQKKVVSGDWLWKLVNETEHELPVHGFLIDYTMGWERSLEFDKWESSDTTICHPSTADSAISVAAYAGEFGKPGELGSIRAYSSRGPRMDGFLGIDVAAPDDPWVPLARLHTGILMGNLEIDAGYVIFGGTSGAAPHVAGALGLLKQALPHADAQTLFKKLVNGALAEPQMGVLPNKEWGFGKLHAYASAFGNAPSKNLPPVARAELAWRHGMYVRLDASGSTDPEGGELEFEWDLNYDGFSETGWCNSPIMEMSYDAEGRVVVKVTVRDEGGLTDSALSAFEVADDWVPPDPGPDAASLGADVSTPPVDSLSSGPPRQGGSGCQTGAAGRAEWLLVLLGVCCALIIREQNRRRRPLR